MANNQVRVRTGALPTAIVATGKKKGFAAANAARRAGALTGNVARAVGANKGKAGLALAGLAAAGGLGMAGMKAMKKPKSLQDRLKGQASKMFR